MRPRFKEQVFDRGFSLENSGKIFMIVDSLIYELRKHNLFVTYIKKSIECLIGKPLDLPRLILCASVCPRVYFGALFRKAGGSVYFGEICYPGRKKALG